jgi:ornithine decarboxylase
MDKHIKTIAALADGTIHKPLYVYRPKALEKAARFFIDGFNGVPMFAVKTNPEPYILESLRRHGLRAFDVASLEEVARTRALIPEAELYFMHPVKSRHAIREAYRLHGVRNFSLDSADELAKILQETGHAKDLSLFLRLAIPNTYAELNLAEKFGAPLQEAPKLLKIMRKHAEKLGVCFHVGSQCMHPDAYRIAIRMTSEVISQAGVPIEFFNVGGGFPSIYPGMIPPAMRDYFDAIHEEFAKTKGHERMTLLAEPGRALVAESTSIIVRVELRKGNSLYINDGTYGNLFDAGTPHFIFPVRLLRTEEPHSSDLAPFSFYGPTCDSLDFMKGPFYLPNDVREGDYVEIGQLGAYGRTMVTGFNGFAPEERAVSVSDEPLMTMYGGKDGMSGRPLEVIAA